MRAPFERCTIGASALAGLLVALLLSAGCHRGSPTDVTDEPKQSSVSVTFSSDQGTLVTSYAVGEPVFVAARGLPRRGMCQLELRGPVAAPPAAETATKPAAASAPAGPGPGATAPEVQPATGRRPEPPPPGGPQDGEPPVPSPQPPPEGVPDSSAPAPTADADLVTTAETASAASAPVGASAEAGPLVSQARYVADGDGQLPLTEIARAIGETSGRGSGRYTVLLRSEASAELGRATFDVSEAQGPVAFASDATGQPGLRFAKSAGTVWACARRLAPNTDVSLYVVADANGWTTGAALESVTGRVVEAHSDASGKVLVELWNGPDQVGGYDVIVDGDNSGTFTSGDVVSGWRTTGFVVYDTPLAVGEADLATSLACGEDYYTAGSRGALTSKEGLFVRGLGLSESFGQARNPSVYVCAHREQWETGTALESRAGEPVSLALADPTGLPRTLVWPGPLLPGSYDIVVDVDGDAKYTRGVDLLDAASAEKAGVVVSDAGNLVTARGKVVDGDGKPVEGAVVTCADSGQGSTTTGADGTFALAQVLPVPSRLTVVAKGFAPSEQALQPSTTDTLLNVQDIALKPATSTAGAYLPLVDGGEWRYDVDRTLDVTDTAGAEAQTAKTTETGSMVRGLTRGDDGSFSLSERETVSAEPDTGTLQEFTRESRWALVPGAEGLMATIDDRTAVWLPVSMQVGQEFDAGPFRLGDFTVWGKAKLEDGGEVRTAAGTYTATLVLALIPAGGRGKSGDDLAAKGTVRIWLAPDVGEVRREADVTLDSVTADPATGSHSVSTHLSEKLELTSAKVG